MMTESDRREAAAIERRRQREEERKKRIFDPRTRIIGVDTKALQSQVYERKQTESEQKKIERLYGEQMIKYDKIAIAQALKEQEERRKLEAQIHNYRLNYQKPEDRREYDLNDPDYVKKQLPPRLYDDDPRLGPSAGQIFDGEDLQSNLREKIQHEEIKAALEQQIIERDAADKQRKAAEEAYREAVRARGERAMELDMMEKKCRKMLQDACLRFNRALAEERTFKMENDKRQDLEDSTAEIYNALTSDFLTENPEIAQSNLGPHRKIVFHYKGMSDEERQNIRKEQLVQIEEVKKQKQLEAKHNKEMDDYLNWADNKVNLMDHELEVKQRSRNKQLAEENILMAKEIQYKMDTAKIVDSNGTDEDFYDQFNTSTR